MVLLRTISRYLLLSLPVVLLEQYAFAITFRYSFQQGIQPMVDQRKQQNYEKQQKVQRKLSVVENERQSNYTFRLNNDFNLQ